MRLLGLARSINKQIVECVCSASYSSCLLLTKLVLSPSAFIHLCPFREFREKRQIDHLLAGLETCNLVPKFPSLDSFPLDQELSPFLEIYAKS
jgi:hypothetical protein